MGNRWKSDRSLGGIPKPEQPGDDSGRGAKPYLAKTTVGWLKMNVDVVVVTGKGTGYGAVVRDEMWNFLYAAVRRERAQWSPDLAEIRAIQFGFRLKEMHDLRQIVVETDCQTIFLSLKNKGRTRTDAGLLIEEIEMEANRTGSIKWSFARRECNQTTHLLAHTQCSWDAEEFWAGRPPVFLLSILEHDTIIN
ncbi:unnamed protein product [Linum trigynum]|uniref:RNase H type-1 domain-containing protein n=1 Tax=Linum trigynum TaxID=586398 RepID=A0AAV2GMB1_9ROSI